jgi:trk system potassium uptake protein TrkA
VKIVVAGAGEVGTHLTKMFANENHDIVVIDINEDHLQNVEAHMDVMTISGSSTSFEVLENAKIKDADLFLAVAQSEEINITSSIFAKSLGVKKAIARVDNVEFLKDENRKYFRSLGIDSIICPEKLAANEVVNLLKQSVTSEVFEFSGGLLSLFVVRLDEKAPIINKTLNFVSSQTEAAQLDYRAVAICRDGKTIIPRGQDVFLPNDLVYVITNSSGINDLLTYAGKKKVDISNVMILGGSRIGKKTAKAIENQVNVKIIEKDRETCEYLAEFLTKSLVIKGDGTDFDLLIEEGIKKMDAFVALTGNSETNILSCLLAKQLGVPKTIAEIENIDYIELAEKIGIDTIINKKLIAASHIYGYTMQADVACLKCLTGIDAEVFEFNVRPEAKVTKKTLHEIGFPKEAIIGGIIRQNQGFIAKGESQIKENDKVVVFSLPSAINKIEKYFK